MFEKYVCQINSTIGLVGSIVELQSDNDRTKQLIANGVISKFEQKTVKPDVIKRGVKRGVSSTVTND